MTNPPRDTSAIRQALHQDATDCWIAALRSGTQLNRRNYIRAAFAFVDGVLSIMRQHVLEEVEAKRFVAAPAELALLREETYDLKDNGEIRTRDFYLPALPGVRFTFAIFARSHGTTVTPDYGGEGWQAFRRALAIRHRVTHPKATSDVDVSDNELETVQKAHEWFLESHIASYVEGRANLMAQLEIARRELEQRKDEPDQPKT